MAMTTQAMVMREPGAPTVLEHREIALNWPAGRTEVLVRLKAASVNPADVFFRALGPYVGDGRDCVLGHDGAGIVEAVGEGVTGVRPGDRVCFCNGGVGGEPGTYSQHAVVPEALLARIPDGVDFETAAAAALVFITGWESLVERARIGAGDRVLIHGGAGGTGHVAIQIARQAGARVAATVSSEAKAALARECGAELTINYRDEDFVQAVGRWTGGAGVQAVLDNAGPEVFQASIETLAPYGHLVTLMGTPGDVEDLTAYNNNLTIHNVMMLTPMWKGLTAHRVRQAGLIGKAMNRLAGGDLQIAIQARFDLADAAAAHALLESQGGTGKIVLTM